MTKLETELLAACKAQHEAIDRLFAMLIVATRSGHVRTEKGFMPTESGQPWDALVAGNAAIAKATGEAPATADTRCSLCGQPPLGGDL